MTNVVSIFKNKTPAIKQPIDVTDLAAMIVGWAQNNGIDCTDPAFLIRVTDLTSQLKIMAMDSREYA